MMQCQWSGHQRHLYDVHLECLYHLIVILQVLNDVSPLLIPGGRSVAYWLSRQLTLFIVLYE